MCEIFGLSASRDVHINEYLKEFYSHSNEHPHGWGLACVEDGDVFIEKEPVQASKSKYLRERLSVPIEVRTALAHIRYATIGNVEYRNCHPYSRKDQSGRRWTMVHNGTIFEYAPLNKYVSRQEGDTDSERVLYYLVDTINAAIRQKGQALTSKERFAVLDSVIGDVAQGNKLNLLLWDGDILYVHTNCAGTLYQCEEADGTVFATAPLGREGWQSVTFTTLLAYRDGRQVYAGTDHGKEYIDNPDNYKFLYQIFSAL